MAGPTFDSEHPLAPGNGPLVINASELSALTEQVRKSNGQRGGGRPPVDSKTRARVRKLARDGMSRNGIAREVGISASTVSSICAAARPPISFDRAKTATATAAVVYDAKARRAKMSETLIRDARRVRRMLFEEIPRVHYSVTDGKVEYEGPPTPGEMKDLAVTMGILIDKHLALVKHDSDDRELPAVDRWLAHVLGGAPEQ